MIANRLGLLGAGVAVAALAIALPAFLLSLTAPAPVSAQTATETTVWSGTLTVRALEGRPGVDEGVGCDSAADEEEHHCAPGQSLTANLFTYEGGNDRIEGARILYGNLRLTFAAVITDLYRSTLTLYVDGQAFPLSDATIREHAVFGVGRGAVWLNTDLSWSPGDTVELRLTTNICDITTDVSGEQITVTWNPYRTSQGGATLSRNYAQHGYGIGGADNSAGTITATVPFRWVAGGSHDGAPAGAGTHPHHDSSARGYTREAVIAYVKENTQYSGSFWYVTGPDDRTRVPEPGRNEGRLSPGEVLNILGAGGEERVNVQVRLWGNDKCSNGSFAVPVTRQTQPIPEASGGM